MKKITYILICNMLFITSITFGQTIGTGDIVLSSDSGLEMTAKIEVSSTMVTVTLTGPSDRWFALAIGAPTSSNVMGSNSDLLYYTSTGLEDGYIGGGGPVNDTNDWSLISNNISGGIRTIVATRGLTGSDANDFEFSNSDTSIDLAWARGSSSSLSVGYHGFSNKGVAASNSFSPLLSTDTFELAQFTMYPNPARNFINIGLPQGFQNAEVEIYNYLGTKVQQKLISRVDNSVPTDNLTSGMYLVRLSSEGKSHSKSVIIQ
ncbi:T9SS type A sorting domain-containing protein [Urechidicola sp. KH5]